MLRRLSGKARGLRILLVWKGRATPPDGMDRRPNRGSYCCASPKVTTTFCISPCTPISYTAFLCPTAVSRLNHLTMCAKRPLARMNSDVRLFGMDGMHEGCKKLPRVKKFTMVVAAFLSHTLVGAHSCFSFLLIPFLPLSKNLTRHFFYRTH